VLILATAGHIPVPYVMGYDTSLIDDARENKIPENADNNYYLFWNMMRTMKL
jgi:hypothetical protein